MEKHVCKYEMHRNPSGAPTQNKYFHPRPMDNGKVDSRAIIQEMARTYHRPESEIQATLIQFLDVMASHLSYGRYVSIDGLGGFQITLDGPAGVKDPDNVRGESIQVKGVGFRPGAELLQNLRNQTEFRKGRYKLHHELDGELILDYLQKHFFELGHRSISSRDLRLNLGLSPKNASAGLHLMEQQKYLVNLSEDVHHPNYVPGQRLKPKALD